MALFRRVSYVRGMKQRDSIRVGVVLAAGVGALGALGLGGCGHSPNREYAAIRGMTFEAQRGDGHRRASLWSENDEGPVRYAGVPTE